MRPDHRGRPMTLHFLSRTTEPVDLDHPDVVEMHDSMAGILGADRPYPTEAERVITVYVVEDSDGFPAGLTVTESLSIAHTGPRRRT